MSMILPRLLTKLVVLCAAASTGYAIPDFVEHIPASPVYGEPAGVTMRQPYSPTDGDPVTIWIRIGYSFYYTDVALYYTLDGSDPQGAYGTPGGSTQVLRSSAGQITFVRNEPHTPNNIDWWQVTLPPACGTLHTIVKYRLSAWHNAGGMEIFGNNYGCADGTCDDPGAPPWLFQYTVTTLPWPGRGAPYTEHFTGYPPVHFWKEEGVVGNNYMNVQIDHNGTVYDIYYPSAGCVHGMGTKNEGYVDGPDTFPPGLPSGFRGQMNMNQAMAGLRVDGVTYWLSNEASAGYVNVAQNYLAGTNVIFTTARLQAGSHNILVEQYDFCPKGVTFPNDLGGSPNRGIYLKRFLLTNHGASPTTIQFYFYGDFALNGGDSFDTMSADTPRGALYACDHADRYTSASGEYNPTSFSDYHKSVTINLAASLKLLSAVGGAGGAPAPAAWRESSPDQDQGWIGLAVTLPVHVTKEVDLAIIGGFDEFPGATGTYDWQIAPALDWFLAGNVSAFQTATESYWRDWLAAGTTIDTPDERVDEAFTRGLLATALHLDAAGGGVVAGMHNGAYPFIWPRDAVWAAMTLDRTGHAADALEVYHFLRDVAYRANDTWGKGFWYQKYTTNGYMVWTAPQVDETAAVPWGVYYHYLVTGDQSFLSQNYAMVYEAGRASSEDSSIDTRLYFDDPYSLMHSNNLWEDAWDDFVYSNASVERGLRDAGASATVLGLTADAALFASRAATIHEGLVNRLAWDGETTDISLLGPAYPFEVLAHTDPLIAHVADRINGTAGDHWGAVHPLMNFSGEWQGLLNRYWDDHYWNGGPWTLSTLWYGAYYGERQDYTPGKADIDNHKYRLDLVLDRLGPIGLGAEQIAPASSLLYPGQTDFVHQAAWPNAWESMSFLVDSMLVYLGYSPDAPANTLRIAPKLPSAWTTMTFHNIALGAHRVHVTCNDTPTSTTHSVTNATGAPLAYDTFIRVSAGPHNLRVTQNDVPVAFIYDATTGRVHVTGALATGSGARTTIRAQLHVPGDLNCDNTVDFDDINPFVLALSGEAAYYAGFPDCNWSNADCNADGQVDFADITAFVALLSRP